MAKRKAGTPKKSTRDPSIVHNVDKCCGCGVSVAGSMWADVLVDYQSRWMHRGCVEVVTKADMDALALRVSGPSTISELAHQLAWDRHVDFIIGLERKHPGLDLDRERFTQHLPPEVRKVYLGYRDDPRWKELINGPVETTVRTEHDFRCESDAA